MKPQHYVTFDRINVGATFFKNGNTWTKQSSRTARIEAEKEPYHLKWFYFKKTELCIINLDQIHTDLT